MKVASLAKRCTVIGSVFAMLNERSKAMPKEEMIVCKMNGVFPELFGKCDVTSCISNAIFTRKFAMVCHA